MQKVMISIPDSLAERMRVFIPSGQRSRIIVDILEAEIKKREHDLYQCAVDLENDEKLNKEMEDWEDVVGDNIEPESW